MVVEWEFNCKVMCKVVKFDVDLLVNWQIVEEECLEQIGVGFGFGFGCSNFGWGIFVLLFVCEVIEGKLVVELIDIEIKEVVWCVVSCWYLKESQFFEICWELIDEVVVEMFFKYFLGVG